MPAKFKKSMKHVKVYKLPKVPYGALTEVWMMQKELTKSFPKWTSSNRYVKTLQLTRALNHEVIELEHQLEKFWKGWKLSAPNPDEHEVKMEIIDAWHFLIQISQIYFENSQELYEYYSAKNQENIKRIKRSY